MTTQQVCFRFDVDSPQCLSHGTPRLMEVARSRGVAFTFFVHAGRATSRTRLVRSTFRRTAPPVAETLPVTRKIGRAGAAHVALVNPRIGVQHAARVAELVAAGHEVALHGGRNHRSWQDAGATWDEQRVETEMRWGLATLRAAGAAPRGFSSPAWQGSESVDRVARRLGLDYTADDHGPGGSTLTPSPAAPGLWRIRTALTGEPGGVGYLENLRARGLDDRAVLGDLHRQLDRAEDDVVVLYDHPFWAGTHDADLVAALVDAVRERGAAVTTLQDVASARR